MAENSFLKQCGGFNPAPDFLIQKYGFEAAHTWGAVWRYCQMSEKERPRSHEAMAERAGMSRRTFIKYLNLLIQDGYIEDLDPGVRNRPHLYDTKKGEELIKSGMQNSHTDITTEPEGYANSAQDNSIGMRKLHTSYAEIAQPGMQNLHLIDRETLRESKIGGEPAADSPDDISWQAVLAYTEIVGLKLDKIQGKAIIQLVEESPNFNLARWRLACTTTKLAGVLERNIACRIATYKAGGDYEAMLAGRRNGTHQPPNKSSPAKPLPPDKATRYQELLKE